MKPWPVAQQRRQAMVERKIEIGPSCHFVSTTYAEGVRPDVSLDYTEHASDHWSSDVETSLDINEQKAREIIAFLEDAFDIGMNR